jgi:glycosyltransferase involved in cell wall biosynthesis
MPALNEEKDIEHVIAALPKEIEGVDCIEYLVIDDGSTDKTAELALAAGAKVVLHRRNRGVGAAFQSAVQFALENEADILVGIDADRQFDPAEIPAILAPILSQRADMVIGNRFTAGMPAHMPPLKYWGNKKIAQLVSYVSGQTFQDVSCGFRAYSREALFHLHILSEFTYTHETILSLAYQGLRIVEYPITVTYDPERKSRVAASILNYAMQTSKIVLRVMLDYRPIRVFGALGAIFMLIGMAFEIFLLGHFVLTQSFSPYKATGFIGLGFLVFGMLVLIIALVADMLNRLRMSQNKVLYELKKIRYDKRRQIMRSD